MLSVARPVLEFPRRYGRTEPLPPIDQETTGARCNSSSYNPTALAALRSNTVAGRT
jgi:hypothetical protein